MRAAQNSDRTPCRARAVRAKCSLVGLTSAYGKFLSYIRTRISFAMLKSILVSIHGVLTMRAWPVARSIFDAPYVREANEGTTSWINGVRDKL